MRTRHPPERHLSRREVLQCGLYGSLTAGLGPALWLGGCGKKQSGAKPSIILISVDTLRADHLGCYGYLKKTSSYIDEFAGEALVFENCFSHAPTTSSSLASLMSGFLPHETKVFENLPLPQEVETLVKILQRQGYQTSAVVSNFVLRKGTGWARGFNIYDDTLNDHEQVRNWPERIAENTTNRALELLQSVETHPVFMWIHYQDPHGPYTPPEGLAAEFRDPGQKPRPVPLNQSLSGQGGIPSYQRRDDNDDYYDYVARYDGEINYLDQHFHCLMEGLKELGLHDQALIIFTADHGEGMGENNYYFAHGENLHRSLLHVPLMVKYGADLQGRRSDYVQHLDVVPTILKFLGLAADAPYRGFDLLAEAPEAREIFAEMNSPIVKGRVRYCLINNECKVIYAPLSKKVQLFDLSRDPQETNDLAEDVQYRQQGLELMAQMNRISREDRLSLDIVNQSAPLSEEEKEKLRSLGYIR